MKITLTNLHEATPQQVFDQVAMHLIKQDRKCIDMERCKYRFDNMMCAAGCLISDEEYDQEQMETLNWQGLVRNCLVPDDHQDLISDLQLVHDTKPVPSWINQLYYVAQDYGLNTKVLPERKGL